MSAAKRGEPKRGDRKGRPEPIAAALNNFLSESGLADRVSQASVVPEWDALVGAQIAAVTEPLSIARDGTLFVAVRTSSWMNELSLMEPQLLAALNAKPGRSPVLHIHWRLMR